MRDGPGTDRIRILGIGNVLMGDDAFGPWVIHALEHTLELPPGVCAMDIGTPGLDLTPFLQDVDTVVFVDAVDATGAPGELRIYRKDEILAHLPNPRLSPHDPSLKEALLLLDFAGIGPRDARLVGAIPARVGKGTGLSPEVRKAVPRAVEAVFDELARLGFPARRRAVPPLPAPWWESAPRPERRGPVAEAASPA